ncbi:T9SS type A sorting domain-containing protein [Cryomorphaceae bacterium]|nr:T9SS type A sorting domain-containing protein [Cryomorphaceae bacterium]
MCVLRKAQVLSLLFLFFLPTAGWSQSLPQTDTERLRFLADSFAQVFTAEKAEAIAWARANNYPVRTVTEDGTEIEIMRIENGHPVYYTTDNDDAALSTNTNDLWNGGSLGLNLEGQGMTIGEWDGGSVRSTHQEFNPAVGSTRVTQGDAASNPSPSWHATHVAGTMVAEGDVAAAQGMAPQADLHAYDWNSDDSEMSTEAANGLLVSNHSYGTISGWYNNSGTWRWYGTPSVSATEDYNFGRYNSSARSWDLIAEAAPYYLICKSAGNDRNDDHNGTHEVWSGGWVTSTASRDPDGGVDGYDCVGPQGTAKNILTVAAVSDVTPGYTQPSDVSMSSFSGWGPTDDGRIKPDISGNGIGLYSTDDDSDTDYTNSSGTSMSSPNVAGSLILLQQHYHDLNSAYMRSSTLKALVIHTANECGSNDGPDYAFGWGLLDASAAASAISNTAENTILESTLSDGGTWSYTFTANGATPFSATMAWIDPAGATTGSVLNPSAPRLVNDLDIRLTDGNSTWSPWILDPSNPSNAATTGDNILDNVEKIETAILPAGTYTVNITHKGSLSGGSQAFSLVMTGLPSLPIANFVASETVPCTGDTVTLTSQSSGGPTSYTWSISPNTGWSYLSGSNANSQNPQVVFSSSGTYTISLTASNSLGSDGEIKTNYITVGGLSLPFSEDFESSSTQGRWTVENPDGSTTWQFVSVSGNGGSTAAGIDNYNYSAADNAVVQDHLISPAFDFSGYSNVQLDFEYAYRRYSSGYHDSLSVWISNDCGNSWTRIASYEDNGSGSFATGSDQTSQWTPASASDWCDGSGSPACPNLDLSAWDDQPSIRIRFTNLSGWGNDLFIDNISITGTSSATLTTITAQDDLDCFGDNDGSASVTVSGGVSPYTFTWSNGAVTGGPVTTHNVDVGNFFYNPSDFNINSGDTIIWTQSAGTHNVNGSQATFPNNPESFTNGSAAGGSWTYKRGFTTPGSYNYHCDPHASFMSGSFTVLAVSNNSSISNLSAGSYSCTITDANGLSTTVTYTLAQPSALSASETISDPSNFGASDGQISVTASGGTPPYQFDWSTGTSDNSNPSVESGLADGSYQLTITDANGCTLEDSYTLTQPAPPALTSTSTSTNNLCNGDAQGSASISVSGGVPPYSYTWSNGGATSSQSNLTEGVYGVTATDQQGTTTTASFTLVDPAVLLASASSTNESLAGSMDGTAAVTASGGTPPYTYLWSNGSQISSISSLAAGMYGVTVTDAQNCTVQDQVTISAGTTPLNLTGSSTNVSCSGEADGSIAVTVSGGTTPYSFLWSNGSSSQNLTGLSAGTYSLTVTDNGGQSSSFNAVISEPSALILLASATDESISGASDGAAQSTVSGGTPPYTYLWSTGGNASSLSGLTPAVYGLTVTDDNGCSQTTQVTVLAGVPLLSASGNASNVSCFGSLDGSISVMPSGGMAPYNYAWDDGSVLQNRSGLGAGSYHVTVSDQSGQMTSLAFTLTQPTALVLTLNSSDESISGSLNGTVVSTVSGGTPPYAYTWSTGSVMPSLANLTPGVYTLTITDGNGCSNAASASVGPGIPVLTISGQSMDVLCFGGSDGSIDITVSGGSQPYQYTWSNGMATEDLAGITAGTYGVTATDQSGQSATFNSVISEPSALLLTVSSTNESIAGAADGTVSANPSGGTAPYAYQWNTGSITNGMSSLPAGVYSVTVTDANGCTNSGTATVSTGVSVLSLSAVGTDLSCFGDLSGSIDLIVSGGQLPYTYLWSDGVQTEDRNGLNAGSYSVTVMDQSGQSQSQSVVLTQPTALSLAITSIDESVVGAQDGSASSSVSGGTPPYTYLWSNGLQATAVSGLATGPYSLTVSDANGCQISGSVSIAAGSAVLGLSGLATDVSCAGGSNGTISLTVLGGQAPFAFLWADGPLVQNRTGLVAGSYSVTVTDNIGQEASSSFVITQPVVISVALSSTDETINGASDGSASATVSGGTPPYSYSWSNGAMSNSISGLNPGSYGLTVTDANGCTNTVSTSIAPGTPILSINSSASSVSCSGGSDGSATTSISGGLPPYTYLWSDGSNLAQRIGLGAGTYTVTVSDGQGQQASTSAVVTEPIPITLLLVLTDETLSGNSDGTASTTVSGGTPPYSYNWSNGSSQPSLLGLAPGTYGLTITDANGCSQTGSGTVAPGTSLLVASGTSTDNACAGDAAGTIQITTSGGATPYTYAWSDGATTADRSGLQAGIYDLSISDASGQQTSLSFTLIDPTPLSGTLSVSDESQLGANDGSATMSPMGGTSPYQIDWSTGATGPSIGSLSPGSYSVTVTDANGCTFSQAFAIGAGPAPLSLQMGSTDIACSGTPGSASVTASGGTPPYSYVWSTGGTQASINTSLVGMYVVTVTDNQGQLASDSVFVLGEQFPAQVILDLTDTCLSTISLIITGGNGPYQFDWTDFNDPSNTPNGPTITLANACADAVCLSAACTITDANGCTFMTDTLDFTGCLSSIEEDPIAWNMYPNPGTIELNIESSRLLDEIKVFDMLGRMVHQQSGIHLGKTSLSTESWPSGTYMIHVRMGDAIRRQRWVKTD